MKTQGVRHSRSLCLLPGFPPWLLPSWTEVVGDCPHVRLVIGKESCLTRGDAEGFPEGRQRLDRHVLLGLAVSSGRQLLSLLCTSFCGWWLLGCRLRNLTLWGAVQGELRGHLK